VHGARNFPFRKQTSDLDVDLEDGTTDDPYLEHTHEALTLAVDRARPDVVLVQGGVDPLVTDRLGRLAVTHAGLEARDRLIFETLRAQGLPAVLTLGGGYAEPIDDTILAHMNTYRAAREIFG
jgi:acetoin utilization deacetylase AcuC-like enzyme